MSKKIKGNVLLLLAAFIWGLAFVAQSEGMKYVSPFTFICTRSFLASGALAVYLFVRSLLQKKKYRKKKLMENNEKAESAGREKTRNILILSGVCCGVVLFVAMSLQQIGMVTSPETGKAGFLTALYLVLVPICGIFFRKKIPARVLIAVVIALFGMYLLCVKGGFSVSKGDACLILCAIAFTGHILVVDFFSPKTDGVALSCIQFLVCGILGFVVMFLTEKVELQSLLKAWLPIVYAGVFSGGIGYTLQIVGQKDTDPAMASLLMSMESVFALLGGLFLLHQFPSLREGIGCGLMFFAILLTQIPIKKENGDQKQ